MDESRDRRRERRPALVDRLRMQAESGPARVALLAPGRAPLTHEQLLRQIEETVARLNALGLGRSSRIAMVLPDGPEMAAAFLAVSAGAACLPFHPAWRRQELESAFVRSAPHAVIVPAGSVSPAVAVARAQGVPVLELLPVAGEAGRFSLRGGGVSGAVAGGTAHADDPLLLLQTSGTSAAPKLVTLTHHNVVTAAGAIAAALELTAADRCLSIMPLVHIHGLSAVFASLTAGGSVACAPGFSPLAFFDWLDELRPTWYTASPTLHRAIAEEARRHPGRAARSSLRFIRSASSAMPRDLALELEDLFGVPFLEAYGMTEAAPQIASNRLPPHVRKAGSVGMPAGPEIAIFPPRVDDVSSADAEPLPAHAAGEIAIRGENVCSSGWLRTGDLGYLDGDGHLFVTGRLTDVINRGGEKIAPQEIEAALREHEAVREAVAFGVPHPTLGARVAAAVVLRPQAATDAVTLRRFLAERLAPFKVPQPVLIVDAIPHGPSGKLQRARLAELLGLVHANGEGATAAAPAAPATPLETGVLTVFGEVLGTVRLGTHDDFFHAGGDSLSAMQVIVRLNQRLGVELPADTLFEHPTVTELAAFLEGRLAPTGGSILTREEHGEQRPLSFGQHRLWLLDQLEPGTPDYNMQVALRWSGALSVAALEESLSEIRRRHEVLRTTFPSAGGQPFARVAEPAPLRLPVVTLARLPVTERESELRRLAVEERARPFHLARETLFRPLLVQLGDSDHVLLLTMHHIISDGWSTSVLLRELGSLYPSFAEGRPASLPELPIQYADFAAWQRRLLDRNGGREAQLRHWRDALADLRPVLDLPADRPRPVQRTGEGAGWVTTIGRDTTARLRALGQQEGATLFMTALAAFQTLLLRYSGQEDFAVGTPIANRAHPATEGLIGFFANTLVMRGDLSGDPSFRTYLDRVRRFARGAFANQDLPFEEVVDALRPPRHAGRMPLFQVMFAFQNFPGASGSFASDLEVAPYAAAASSAKFDLTLYLSETPEGLRALWQYSTDLFEETTIAGMAASYEALLEGILADPDCRLSALPLLAPARLDAAPAAIAELAEADSSFLALFAAHVQQTPDAIAVRCGDEALTYCVLDERAATLAARLRRNGAAGALVGVCVPRTANALVALLAVWKAGAVYLPIDPEYPDERIAFLLRDARVAVLVTETALRASLPAGDATVVCLDRADGDEADAAAPSDKKLSVVRFPLSVLRSVNARAAQHGQRTTDNGDDSLAPAPNDPAYVIYTSGSTGPPKGVMISHRNIAHYLGSMRAALGITAHDRYLHTASFAFSSAMRQFLLPLACGATVVIATFDDLVDPLALLDRMKAERATIADLVPSYWRHLIRQLAALPSEVRATRLDNDLRLLLSASEPLLPDLTAQWAELGHPARLINMYGQTETTGIVATYPIAAEAAVEASRVPVGRPIPGTGIHIVDSVGRPVPPGVIGELVVSGPAVGLGYLGRQQETVHRFVTDPSLGRTYRTGDLARLLPDGTLVLLGRIDEQMKVRGFRIEPGEIEAALASDPRVEQCAVVVRRDRAGEDRLAAFVVLRPGTGEPPDAVAAALRVSLRAKLPAYMVPPLIVAVDALPLTPTGKVNRAALVAPEVSSAAALELTDTPIAAPNRAEPLLARLWSEALGREHVRTDDNFFDLGGDSLMGIRMIQAANHAGLALTPQHLFRHQTLGDLARAATQPDVVPGPHSSVLAPPMRVTLESARRCGEEALMRAGLSREHAALFTEVQLEASLRGQTTHNLGAIPRYARRLASGATNASPDIRIERETGVSALLDGDNGPGQLAALAAMELAIRKAVASGIGVVGVRRSNHFGAAGHYVLQAARRGLIGLATTNSALWLAPAGGVTPLFGTNPLAAGIPAGRHHPIVLDVSMSVTAKGKVARHLEEGHPLPPGWILDGAGRPSVDPADLVAGLGIPIGGHKGYGLALVMETLSGVLTGAGFGSDHRRERLRQPGVAADFGHFFIAIDPELFLSRAEFAARVDRMIDEVKGARRMEGVEEILVPGEAELRAREHNLHAGVPLPPAVHQALEKYRREAGLVTELVLMPAHEDEEQLARREHA
ncbi:MAG TPA: amino acid adenylation domain-containing protein [Thermoanaerobaculia bacterium]